MIVASKLAGDMPARNLLDSMEVQLPGRRNADGSVSYRLFPPINSMMFGPFLRLAHGNYCLEFDAGAGLSLQKHQPVLGVEVIAQNRILQAWQDFTADELAVGMRKIHFTVPEELGTERGGDAPFEFRFTAFGTGAFTITRLVLRAVSAADMPEDRPMVWRLLGRMRAVPLPGGVKVSRLSAGALAFGRPWTPLYLPAGPFRLCLDCVLGGEARRRDPERELLDVAIGSRDGHDIGSALFTARDLLDGRASFLFDMPRDLSLASGSPQKLRIRVRARTNTAIRVDALNLVRVNGPASDASARPSKPVPRPGDGRARIIVFGNCQASLLANAFRSSSGFARRFSVTYHAMELPDNLHEQGKRDLEACDILLVQDIREWEHYPLRDHVPDTLRTLRYPCVRFASPWPFDAFNGPDDRQARNKDYPNFEFTYFDGLLARLRREVPDPEARFEAYRDLQVKGAIDPRRLHAYEEKRLLAMDEKFSTEIGAYILENFRKKPVFYTTAHPNGTILGMILKQLGSQLGVRPFLWPPRSLDSLRHLQVPVHPHVAKALDLKWAGADTRYRVRGHKVTWEEYFRRYISYYG